jgi:hypothetical protein
LLLLFGLKPYPFTPPHGFMGLGNIMPLGNLYSLSFSLPPSVRFYIIFSPHASNSSLGCVSCCWLPLKGFACWSF